MSYGSPYGSPRKDVNYTPNSVLAQEQAREDQLTTMPLDAHREKCRADAIQFTESVSPQRTCRYASPEKEIRYGSMSPGSAY
ncbi:hypothetical protein DIPPA_19313 [Diplonema papillatum]|nr:hypothetical protein DIPPA_19313 [Diplonema papillatum]